MSMLNNVSYRPKGIDYARQSPEIGQVKQQNEETRIAQAEEKSDEQFRVQTKLTPTSLGRYIDVKA